MSKDKGSMRVTEENFGAVLIEGLREARAVTRGEAEPAHRVRRSRTARTAEVDPPRPYAAEAILDIRMRMGLSQILFARVLNASSETVRAWEQGKRQPDGMALALLEVADRHPEVLTRKVHGRSSPESAGEGAARTGVASAARGRAK